MTIFSQRSRILSNDTSLVSCRAACLDIVNMNSIEVLRSGLSFPNIHKLINKNCIYSNWCFNNVSFSCLSKISCCLIGLVDHLRRSLVQALIFLGSNVLTPGSSLLYLRLVY